MSEPTTGERLLALLPATRAELIDKLGRSKPIVHKWLTRLKAARAIRIVAWRRTRGDMAAVFGVGPGKNARRPRPLTSAETTARYHASLKAAGLWEDELAAQRKRNARKKPPVVPFTADPLLSALYGGR